jgi:hypothetical protein
MEKEERDQIEKRLAHDTAWRNLEFTDLQDWKTCLYTQKYRGHSGKTFIVWKNTSTGPSILDVYKVTKFSADLAKGFQITLTNEFGEDCVVTHTPTKLSDYIAFIHIPFIQDMQFLPNPNNTAKVLRFPLIIRQAGRPKSMIPNESYVADVVDFVALFPKFADRKF